MPIFVRQLKEIIQSKDFIPMKFKFDGFIVALFISIIVAYFLPQLYTWEGGAIFSWITTVGVSLIFFFYGLKLSFRQIKEGLRNWKLHVLVQLATFVIFPLLVLPFYPLVETEIQHSFWLSFFFLAALPSTVSSSVVMVSIARGNIAAAIFNASISGLIGVVVTPLWMQFFLDFGELNVVREVYWGMIQEIILPMVAGLALQKYWGAWALHNAGRIALFDKTVILLIVYGSFAESFVSGIFDTINSDYLVLVFLLSILMFFVVYGILYLLVRYLFKFSLEDQITALFCGSKKSLTHGSVFGKFLFINSSNAGLLFLPLMIFHAFQILVVTVIAQRYNKRSLR